MRTPGSVPSVTSNEPLGKAATVRARAHSEVQLRAGRPLSTGFAALARAGRGARGSMVAALEARRESELPPSSSIEEIAYEQRALAQALRMFDLDALDLPRDPSVHAAALSMADRVADLGELRSALGAVFLDASDPRMFMSLARDGALTEYLRGLYAWSRGVLRAMDELAHGLRALTPDWALLRRRLEDARTFYLVELEGAITLEVARLRLHWPAMNGPRDPLSELDAHLAELFWAAAQLARSLEKRFG